jgi:hypothetical protein
MNTFEILVVSCSSYLIASATLYALAQYDNTKIVATLLECTDLFVWEAIA